MNDNQSTTDNTNVLTLHIDGAIMLIELTARITQLCQQAEQEQAMICIKFLDCSLNMSDFAQKIQIQDVNRWEQAVRRIERLSHMVIAVVSGTLSGPGFDLLLTADYRIAAQNCQFVIPINQ